MKKSQESDKRMSHDIFILFVQRERAKPVPIHFFEELNGISKVLDASHEAFKSFMVVQIT